MAEFLLAVMFVAATLYAVLGGADFGLGLIEGLVDEHDRERVQVALAPVWEANHVWLVLVAVLAFVGFPALYTVTCTYLHIPLLCVLLGIVARGSAFTFRHYDPESSRLERSYTWFFRAGSLLTPLALGIIVATTASDTLSTATGRGFYATFIAPWNTPFAWVTGLFVCTLFAFEGAALLSAEFGGENGPLPYLRLSRRLHLAAIFAGALVFAVAFVTKVPFAYEMLSRPLSLTCMGLATLLIPLVARSFRKGHPWTLRMATGAQVALVLAGFFAAQFPVLVRLAPDDIAFPTAAAAPESLTGLTVAVCVGLLLILPAMGYLLFVYKRKREEPA